MTKPTMACWLPKMPATAPLFFDPDPLPEPLPVCELPEAVEGALGVKIAEGLVKQELTAALAFVMEEGAFLLTVAFPAKSQDCGLRLLAS